MSIAVSGRVELARIQADHGFVGVHELVGADQLIVAGEGGIIGIPCCVSKFAGIGPAGGWGVGFAPWIRVRERGVLGPDAGI